MYGHRAFSTGKSVYGRARAAQLSFLAASLAYYMLVSLFPLGLLAFVVASTIGGEAFAERVIATASAFLSPSGTELLDQALRAGAGRGGATVAGIALLVWSSLRVFRGLDIAFTLAYGHRDPGSLPHQFLDATVALLGIGIAVVSLAVVNAALAMTGLELTDVAGTLLLVGTLVVAFYPLYYVFPDVELRYRDAVPGAAFAAIGWTALGAVFAIYAANAATFALYGAIGAVLLLVTWFYLAGIILLLGAVLNAVVAGVEPVPIGSESGTAAGSKVETAPADRVTAAAEAATGAVAHRDIAEEDAGDRQRQKAAARNMPTMSEDAAGPTATEGDVATAERPDQREVERLREELAELREEVDDKTLPREELESDLRRYVRARVRRGHARGWGPYLVLLYGTVMTLGAFYFLTGLVAIFAMFVIWLSTLGLYALMLIVGITTNAISLPGRVLDRIRDFRG